MKLALSLFLVALPALAATPNLSVRLAYYDSVQKTLTLQGETGWNGISGACYNESRGCECVISVAAKQKAANPVVRYDLNNGTVTCAMGSEPAPGSFVKLHTSDYGDSVLLPVKASLTLDEVLKNLDPSLDEKSVNNIYRYSCEKTFFEGEGVTSDKINCLPGQHLGTIQTEYYYNLFSNPQAGFNAQPFGNVNYPGVCGRPEGEFQRISCDDKPELRFGLVSRYSTAFGVHVKMYRAPEQDSTNQPLLSEYGFAAPSHEGVCPIGLVPAFVHVATPDSITGTGIGGDDLPTSFIDDGHGSLWNYSFDPIHPMNMYVKRFSSLVPCDGKTGDCSGALFNSASRAQSVEYTQMGDEPDCVIPPALLK
jgi:hypothetical protein